MTRRPSKTRESTIFCGIYTTIEAAFYARIQPVTMQRWLYGGAMGEPVVFTSSETSEHIVKFVDFVQALAIRSIRTAIEGSVSLQKIRQAVERARDEFGIEYPFARRHTLYAVGRDICIVPEQTADGDPVRLTGKDIYNQEMRPIIQIYMRDLHYNPAGFADMYTLYRHIDCEIRMNPMRRFGEPLVGDSGYSAYALWHSANIEGGIAAAAEINGVSELEVETAVRCIDYLEPKPKAA